jgi:hypothetical protein
MSGLKNAIICYTSIKQAFFIEIPSGIFRLVENQIRYRLHSMRNTPLFAYHLATRRYNPDGLLFANNYITEIYNLQTITGYYSFFAFCKGRMPVAPAGYPSTGLIIKLYSFIPFFYFTKSYSFRVHNVPAAPAMRKIHLSFPNFSFLSTPFANSAISIAIPPANNSRNILRCAKALKRHAVRKLAYRGNAMRGRYHDCHYLAKLLVWCFGLYSHKKLI